MRNSTMEYKVNQAYEELKRLIQWNPDSEEKFKEADIMSEHREGTLFYDTETGRYDIRFDLESFYGGLHCGECFDVKVKNVWVPVRIEMGDDWYLVGLNVSRLDGLRVRM